MPTEFKLPELGENVEKGDVVRVLVAPGDVIKAEQSVVELETDKATIEVPSSVGGKVREVRVKAGDKVKVGQVVLVVDEAAPAAVAAPAPQPATPATASPVPQAATVETKAQPRPDRAEAPAARHEVVDISAARPAAAARAVETRPNPAPSPALPAEAPAALAPAAPLVRRFARELGIDIAAVPGTGPGGRIGSDDVKDYVRGVFSGGTAAPAARPGAMPDFTKWGEIDTRPMSNIRRKTAEQLTLSWQAPHVTQHDRADVTALESFRASHGPRVEKAGGKLTVTAILLKIVAHALAKFPQFASSVDMAAQTIVFKKYCHIGVAVDTPNGLLVPVIRQADRKTITEMSVELATLSQKARDRKLSLDEMSGGVFSITNLGGIGGTAFTPIVNQPEVAILGVSRAATEPVWLEPDVKTAAGTGRFVPRQMLPLSLSYDHRVIDGADAARFLRFIVEALENPLSMSL